MAVNLDHFIINSDYPMDLVVFATEGTVAANSSTSVPHNLPFTPLPFGVWSSDNGITWQPITEMNPTGTETVVEVSADSTNITVSNSVGPGSIKFRVFGLQPAGSVADISPPNFSISNFVLNSDFNYSKLVASTVWTVTVANGITVVTHNLGYIPEVIAWRESSSGVIKPFINSFGFSAAGEACLTADSNTVKVSCPGGAGGSSFNLAKIHVRVYGGKNG